MKKKILQEFLDSDIKIKSQEKLEEYIDHCILNNRKEKMKFKTEHHHILPNKLFDKYSNLKIHEWNGTHLTYGDHYIAHSLLAEALDNFSMTAAWWAMNNLNSKSGKIEKPKEIIGKKIYSKLKEDFSNKISNWFKEEVTIDGVTTTRGNIHTKKLNESMRENVIFEGKEMSRRDMAIIKKHRNTDTLAISRKAAKTMTTEFIDENRNLTSIRKEANKKATATNNKKYIDEKGSTTTKNIERGRVISKVKLKNSKLWNVYDKDDNLVYEKIYTKDLKILSQGLLKTSKDKRLGSNIYSVNNLKRVNKEYLIGYYALQIK